MDVHRVCIEKDKRGETFIVRVKGRAGRKSRDRRAARHVVVAVVVVRGRAPSVDGHS